MALDLAAGQGRAAHAAGVDTGSTADNSLGIQLNRILLATLLSAFAHHIALTCGQQLQARITQQLLQCIPRAKASRQRRSLQVTQLRFIEKDLQLALLSQCGDGAGHRLCRQVEAELLSQNTATEQAGDHGGAGTELAQG